MVGNFIPQVFSSKLICTFDNFNSQVEGRDAIYKEFLFKNFNEVISLIMRLQKTHIRKLYVMRYNFYDI